MSQNHSHSPSPDHRSPLTYHQFLGLALNELLIEHGLYSKAELHDMIRSIELVDPATHGARVVARSWTDADFKQHLLTEANAAIASIGLDPGPAELRVLENTPETHHVVVCTLCSCYPRALLGRPPAWYKSREYRARMVRMPRKVLAEFGLSLAKEQAVRVHDSTAELRFLVLPERPIRTEHLAEPELAERVTRDGMIGVAKH